MLLAFICVLEGPSVPSSLLDMKPLGSALFQRIVEHIRIPILPLAPHGACMIGSVVVNLPASGS
jgi:hypothetical protein